MEVPDRLCPRDRQLMRLIELDDGNDGTMDNDLRERHHV